MTNFLSTNWEAMTTNDWIGLILTVVIFILMIIAYFYVFKPGNREKLEAHRYIVMDEESSEEEKEDDR